MVLGIILLLIGLLMCKSCYNNFKAGIAGYYSKAPYVIGPLLVIVGIILIVSC